MTQETLAERFKSLCKILVESNTQQNKSFPADFWKNLLESVLTGSMYAFCLAFLKKELPGSGLVYFELRVSDEQKIREILESWVNIFSLYPTPKDDYIGHYSVCNFLEPFLRVPRG